MRYQNHLMQAFVACMLLVAGSSAWSQAAPPPPGPDTVVGDTVTNLVTGETTVVLELIYDPPGTTDPAELAWVRTSDDYVILVKNDVGDVFYDGSEPPVAVLVVASDPSTAEIQFRENDDPDSDVNSLDYALTDEVYSAVYEGVTPPPDDPVDETGGDSTGLVYGGTGRGGDNGSWGFFFVPPSDGDNGHAGPSVILTNTLDVVATSRYGIEARSIGGRGGNGGDSIFSWWSPGDGGNGGTGGVINLTNNGSIATSGAGNHGIFAVSRSGNAGNGGDGILAIGSGSGGAAPNGGPVTVINNDSIYTTGEGAHGIYALSQSGNGGTGGASWGLVGTSGNGFPGGDGGPVSVTNNGRIETTGAAAQGIFAQSVGGTGGSAGPSGGLLAYSGAGEAGGDGGSVGVTNNGAIITSGDDAKGILAQSVGGGGGTGGSAGGLVALGGKGAGGGSSGLVTVTNSVAATISTSGLRADGIFAQSVGGSGGGGGSSGGLVAVGGDGAIAGNGGAVTVRNFGTISTAATTARGIVAQSIGGGGGDGGSSGGMVAVGGSGAGGGFGSTVTVANGGSILTGGTDAPGIFAQSVGGGGGNGGSAGSVSAFVGVAVGGDGAGGGNGGDVNLTLQGVDADTASVISTDGHRSTGVFAQSVGGGGGNGGGAVQVTGGYIGAVSIAVGGDGGGGGTGGTVNVLPGDGGISVIDTGGDDASGMFVQSVGGGGGNGGYSISVAVAGGDTVGGALSVAVGGDAGVGGDGGTVNVGTFDAEGNLLSTGFSGSILTRGDRSSGFVAQSVGGGGGNGGLAIAVPVAASGAFSASLGVGVGGAGGAGGIGGSVSVGYEGNVTTEGDNSTGMLIQSVGGGGGNGGGSIAASLSASGGGAVSASVSVGGDAGAGSTGGTVLAATRDSVVTTSGNDSTGIIVQSVGGGGGNGGYSVAVGIAGAGTGAGSINVGLGGQGGTGGDAGIVGADLQSDVTTAGDNATGILVQSVGGGGGNGGFNVSGGIAAAGTGAGTVSVGLGGEGGAAGTGNTVVASSSGDISTSGSNSAGLMVQSIGGGGGNGGFNVSGSLSGAGTASGAVSVGLGGNAGGGGTAGMVVASNSGDVTTRGAMSVGIMAQSVGGGGGNGGFNVDVSMTGAGTGSGAVGVGLGGSGGSGADGGTVALAVGSEDAAVTVTTLGDDSAAVIAQSIGGGGGNGAFNVTVAGAGAGTGAGSVGVGLGGSGAGGGAGNTVTSAMVGDISTQGADSVGFLAQSVGGGGGNGGFNVAASISAAGTGAGGASIGLGGSAGSGGNSGAVAASLTGDVTTLGAQSTGVVAQSLGGGGGNGGVNVSGTLSYGSTGSGGASVGIGGAGGSGGDAGAVTSTVTGDVTTSGIEAGGVLAQSVGGGGGNGGLNVSGTVTAAGSGTGAVAVGIGGSGGGGGDGSAVTSTVTGDVTTTGGNGYGVLAQSLGGGGGNGGINVSGAVGLSKSGAGAAAIGIGGSGGVGGDAGTVTSTVTGDVHTTGNDAYGVLSQSIGGGGGNGGTNISGAVAISNSGAGAVAVGIGGSGGEGGFAEATTSTVTGVVMTEGERSGGVVTQSLGGGGGNGGLNVSGTLTASKTLSGGLAVGIGGFGGGGNDGRAATSTVTGNVVTYGIDSPGILTQSLGGGGGNGGVNVSAAVNISKERGGALGVGVGGFGGDGGNAGAVTSTVTAVDENAVVATFGDNSTAIMAQSVGGSGGNGGVNVTGALNIAGKEGAAIGVGVGGFGGGGFDGGNVTVNATGDVLTSGADSHGLVAQSLGGGGGNGGVNVTGTLDIRKEETGGSAAIGVGGFGGGAGDSGDVSVTYQGTIVAAPEAEDAVGSHGIMAQSLAGGGGNGAVNVSAGLAFTSTGENGDGHALVVGVGGFGGGGGDAGAVTVQVNEGSAIRSLGDERSAIFAQSVGGGGGNGGLNVSGGIAADAPIVFGMGGFGGAAGTASSVTVNAQADLFAEGDKARGIFAQSVGGGGGNGGLNVSGALSYSHGEGLPAIVFGLGGFGGAGAISDNVDVTHAGDISTSGEEGHGIFAQSLAGGGGNGGMNVSTALILSSSEDSGGFKDISITGGLGGHGGEGADAGSTDVSSVGDIATTGDYARGVFAQSIGGGGGNGGMNFVGNIAQKSSMVTFGVGGFGAGGGHAGDVSVLRGDEETSAGSIVTDGIAAIGIEANSIGGGGGDAGLNLVASVSFAGEGDGGGDGGGGGDDEPTERQHPQHTGVDPEVFDNYDKVLDELEGRQKEDKEDKNQKKDESGFAVQVAIGGSGGGAGDGGDTNVENYGDVQTLGRQSHGILAQSVGGGGGNAAMNIALTYFRGDAVNRGLNLALGGATGDGGAGGNVDVIHDGVLETVGDDSYGIVAQSIGGGGGNASAFLSKSEGDSSKLDISIGRRGGSGGEGGDVSLSSAGTVVTRGDRSWGLIAQSIGNGGGNSAATTISGVLDGEKGQAARGASLSVGLEGGEGGSAGDVTLNAEGLVGTEGTSAHAIFAQSVGGGGGNGGDAEGSSANASISLGGSGGTGGTGGAVNVTASAEVRTLGAGAYGLIAQSIGGGGGTGGKSNATVESSEPGLAISLGGTGGTGSVGGAVSVENSGVIITGGDEAIGVFAQSLGGGGGNGGMTITSLKTKKPEGDSGTGGGSDNEGTNAQLAVNVGGAGGTGGTAGDVLVLNAGGVGTAGAAAAGIFAQSIGGGGGNASQVVSQFSGAGLKLNTGIGGVGGTGGTGGEVTVRNLSDEEGNAAQIVTMGNAAHGIVAMSIGGGGGNGSMVVTENEQENESADDLFSEPRTMGVSLAVGGEGGTGGTSGLVTVENDGEIVTQGQGAHGIFAQSIGGGGGNGGITYTKDKGLKGINSSVDSSISLGGVGGDGNVSGDVMVLNTGSIEVHGDESYGVFAQSIGGGGGNGGMSGAASAEAGEEGEGDDNESQPQAPSSMSFTLGGEGGEGADSGNVTVDHQGSIVAHGDNAYGIYAQSIAGGGGSAGATYSTLGGAAAEFVLPLLLGSRDGGSGEAGSVTVNTAGDITMLGEGSQPFLAQSVNGGGGNVRLTLDTSNTTLGQVNPGPDKPEDPVSAFIVALVEVGSTAVEDGLGAAIQSEHVGTLLSLGKSAPASSTQSVGGGGGNANVDLTVNPDAVVELEFLLGGADSVNSGGGAIGFRQEGDAATMGDGSKAVSVQSIGGGGGNLNLTINTVPGPEAEPAAVAARPQAIASADRFMAPAAVLSRPLTIADHHIETDPDTGAVSVSLGADGSAGNDGGDVDAAFIGDISTEGILSPGLVVQSIGAGGGDVQIEGAASLEITLGGTNDASGDGGDISVVNTGRVETRGLLSHGLVLQSIGGGGGLVRSDLSAEDVSVELRDDNEGSGGNITFAQTGDVVVSGERSIALAAQSIGGGGGMADRIFQGSAGGVGAAGAVTVNVDGSLVASGDYGVGAFLQSVASDEDDQGNLRLFVGEGHLVHGGKGGIGVWFSGGLENLIENRGVISTADGADGQAIRAEGGNNEVDNYGMVAGSVDLGSGDNLFRNREGAIFAPGGVIMLGGPDSLLLNDGTLAPWDMGRAQPVVLSGSLTQTGTGLLLSEIDFQTDRNDVVLASGRADLAGTADVSLLNVRFIPVGEFQKDLVFAGLGVADSGMTLETAPSVVIDYDLVYSTQAAELHYAIDFVPEGMGENLNAIGGYINRGQQAGGGSAEYGAVIEKLVYDPDLASYKRSLSQLSPEVYAEQQAHLIERGIDFGQKLMSCQQFGGEYRFTREGTCIWAQFEDQNMDLEPHGGYKGIDSDTRSVSLGWQHTGENDWTFGLGFSNGRTKADGYGGLWSSEMRTNQLGMSLKHRWDAFKLAGVLTYAWSDTETRRRGTLLEPFSTDADRSMDAATLALRAQYDFEFGSWFLRPKFDFGVLSLRARGTTEDGLGAASLVLEDYSETHPWIRPAFQAGKEFELSEEYRLRLNVELAAQQYFEGGTDVEARFRGLPSNVDSMVLQSELDDPRVDGSIGFDLLGDGDATVQFYYQRSWSEHRDGDSIRLKFQMPL